MEKIAEYTISRKGALFLALLMGIAIGVLNVFVRPIDFTFSFALIGWLTASIVAVVFIHEGVHGGTALLFGQKPIFGFKLPLVYVTFSGKIPRGVFILVAMAPLVLLDIVFGVLYYFNILKTFAFFSIMVNTIGAIGDIWIVLKLLPQKTGTLIQDTKTGIEVWKE